MTPKPIASRLAFAALTAAAMVASGTARAADAPVIGLITKTDTNPCFVKMKEGAKAAAKAKDTKLLSAAGQVTAIEIMVAGGAKTILNRRDAARPVAGRRAGRI